MFDLLCVVVVCLLWVVFGGLCGLCVLVCGWLWLGVVLWWWGGGGVGGGVGGGGEGGEWLVCGGDDVHCSW